MILRLVFSCSVKLMRSDLVSCLFVIGGILDGNLCEQNVGLLVEAAREIGMLITLASLLYW